jgi:hypothetical protein
MVEMNNIPSKIPLKLTQQASTGTQAEAQQSSRQHSTTAVEQHIISSSPDNISSVYIIIMNLTVKSFYRQLICMMSIRLLVTTPVTLSEPRKLLVLGGTGFVGNTVVAAARRSGMSVVSVSRRGTMPDDQFVGDNEVKRLSADVGNIDDMRRVASEHGPFSACVHAIGLLFDSESGLLEYNKFASGSKSVPGSEATYDRITCATAFNAIDCLLENREPSVKPLPFIFVSAAEAGWYECAQITPLIVILYMQRSLCVLQDFSQPGRVAGEIPRGEAEGGSIHKIKGLSTWSHL